MTLSRRKFLASVAALVAAPVLPVIGKLEASDTIKVLHPSFFRDRIFMVNVGDRYIEWSDPANLCTWDVGRYDGITIKELGSA